MGRLISFLGSTAALGLMTVISVLIGYCFKSVPDALKSSVPIGQYLSVACMLYFGVRTITVRPPYYFWFPNSALLVAITYWRRQPWCELCEVQEAAEIPVEAERESGEMESAQESLAEAEKSGNLRSRAAFQNLLQV